MGKVFLWGLLIIIVFAGLGFGGWYLFLKKVPEGSACVVSSKCEEGLKCLNKICSSGKTGASCEQKTDCTGQFCVKNICTEGKLTSACVGSKDCQTGLLCVKESCAQKPDYSLYFDKVTISKMKPGTKPDPNNLSVTSTFSAATDAIGIDFTGVKTTTVGSYYFEFVNASTGKVARSTGSMNTNFEGRDTGAGTDLRDFTPGEYDANIYYQNKLVYSTAITITK